MSEDDFYVRKMHKSTSTAENSERLAEFSAVLANRHPLLSCEFEEAERVLKVAA